MNRTEVPAAVGLQLHSLQESEVALPDLVRQVGALGFDGVEFAERIHDADPRAIRSALSESGVEAFAGHVPLPRLEADLDEMVERYAAVDCTRLVIPHIRAKHFLTRERVDSIVDRLLTLADLLGERGFELLIHNSRPMHYPMLDRFPFAGFVGSSIVPQAGWYHAPWALDAVTPNRLRGETAFERLVDRTGTVVSFEIDTKEVITAGRDLGAVLDGVEGRVDAVHLSNARATRRFPPTFRGSGISDGVVDIESSLQTVLERGVEWVILESEDPEETLSVTTAEFDAVLGALGITRHPDGDGAGVESRAISGE